VEGSEQLFLTHITYQVLSRPAFEERVPLLLNIIIIIIKFKRLEV
jgi:hypothetical protein